jgi:hypothetical protein
LHDCSRVGPCFQRNPMVVRNDWLPVGSAQKVSVGQPQGGGGPEVLNPRKVPSLSTVSGLALAAEEMPLSRQVEILVNQKNLLNTLVFPLQSTEIMDYSILGRKFGKRQTMLWRSEEESA